MARSQMGEEPSSITGRIPQRAARVRRPDPPNRAAFGEQIADLEGQIDCLQGRIVEIKTVLDNRLHNRHVVPPEILAARSRLSELNDLCRKAIDTKKIHREELDVIKEKLRVDARSGVPYVNADQIDEEIQKLEYRQTHTTLHIDAEKKLLQQVAKLKKSKEALISQESRTHNDLEARSRLIECIKEDDERIDGLKAQQEEQRRVLAEIREREASAAIDVPALLEEKNLSYGKIKALREEIKKLKAEFSSKEDEYWRKEREWRAQDEEDRKVKAEKIRAERLEREKIRKQRALENFVEPYTDEIILCDQLISYMQKISPAEESLSQPQQKPEALASAGFGDILISKKDRKENDLEGWFAGYGGTKSKKSKPSVAQKSKLREKISLSIDALSSFEKVKVQAPTTYSDVMKKIEALQKQREKYIEMQKQAKEGGQNGVHDLSPEKSQSVDKLVIDHSSGIQKDSASDTTNKGNALSNTSIFDNGDKNVEHFPKLGEDGVHLNTKPEISDEGAASETQLVNGGEEEPCEESSETAVEASLSACEADQGEFREHISEELTGHKASATCADCGSVDEADIERDAIVTEKEVGGAERGDEDDIEVSKLTLVEASTAN